MNVVGVKWVNKGKYKVDNAIERLKAHLVTKDCNQQEGVNFAETFSLVVKPTTIQLVLSLAIVKQWTIHWMDVKNVFLNGVLQETVYIN